MSSSNCCFLTCIQISQERVQVVWYSHLLKNFPQFIVIHTIKGFGIVNKAEIDVFLELSCFFDDPADVGNLISGSSAFSKTITNYYLLLVMQWLSGKESSYNVGVAGNSGFIPGSERSSREGHGNPLQFSCLENRRDRGAWRAAVHRVTESDTTEVT